MPLININSSTPDDLFKTEFPVLPAGKHLFEIVNDVAPEAPSNENASYDSMLKFEFRCQDDDDNKGMPVFENILIVNTPVDSKAETTKRIHDSRLAQLIAACGILTMDQIKNGEQFDTASFKGARFEATSKVVQENVYPEELDENGRPKKAPRARISKFLFEPAK